MSAYLRHKRNGEVRMDFYTFRNLKPDRIAQIMWDNRKPVKVVNPHKVKEMREP